ncbi:hypothetical protein TSAR_013287, partial [Trichomalopsis sarcophagae]
MGRGVGPEESGHRLDSGSPFWRIQLDQDLLDTISAIYPEWFKDYTSSRASTSGPNAPASLQSHLSQLSSSSSSSNSSSSSSSGGSTARKPAKPESKLKSKLKKIEEKIFKGRKDKRDIKENRDRPSHEVSHVNKKLTKAYSSKEKTGDIVLKKSATSISGSKMAEGNQSPPKAEVDDSPLQQSMDRNKE